MKTLNTTDLNNVIGGNKEFSFKSELQNTINSCGINIIMASQLADLRNYIETVDLLHKQNDLVASSSGLDKISKQIDQKFLEGQVALGSKIAEQVWSLYSFQSLFSDTVKAKINTYVYDPHNQKALYS